MGVAISDARAVLASPLETVPRDRRRGSDLDRIIEIVKQHEVTAVVVGMPTSLSGEAGRAAKSAAAYAGRLARRLAPVPVHTYDERLTTVIASRVLAEQGVRGNRRRAVVDQAAAVLILQSWLERQRRSDG